MEASQEFTKKHAEIRKNIFKGFFPILVAVSSAVFTIIGYIIPPDVNHYKKVIILTIISVSISLIMTILKNFAFLINRIKDYEREINNLQIQLQESNIKLINITNNRDTILEEYNIYKKEAAIFKNSYIFVKSNIFTFSDMINNQEYKSVIESIFYRVENDLIEGENSDE
jgi:hypothetical protein|nr:hypothetical protein [uncultured Romboutsia sp.]